MKRLVLLCSIPVFFAVIISGCRKEEPAVDSNTPVFYVNASLGSNTLSLQAGVNGYYMYSSFASDSQNVYAFTGDLKQEGCASPCPSSLIVTLFDYAPHVPTPTILDSSLHLGNYPFVSSSAGYTVLFNSQVVSDSVISYAWNFGDNGTSTLPSPSHTYASPGIYTVCLTITFFHNNVQSTQNICNQVSVGGASSCGTGFTFADFSGDSVVFNAQGTGTPPFTYSWDLGDSAVGTGSPLVHIYQPFIPSSALFLVSLTTTDGTGCTSVWNEYVPLASTTVAYANFTYQAVSGPSSLGGVVLEWTDPSGAVYSSADGSQFSGSFQVMSVDDYADNEAGQHTKKIRALVSCTLYLGSSTVQLNNAEIVFAVAHP